MKLINEFLNGALAKSSIIVQLINAVEKLTEEMVEVRKSRILVADVLKTHLQSLKQHNVLINELYERQTMMFEQVMHNDSKVVLVKQTKNDLN